MLWHPKHFVADIEKRPAISCKRATTAAAVQKQGYFFMLLDGRGNISYTRVSVKKIA